MERESKKEPHLIRTILKEMLIFAAFCMLAIIIMFIIAVAGADAFRPSSEKIIPMIVLIGSGLYAWFRFFIVKPIFVFLGSLGWNKEDVKKIIMAIVITAIVCSIACFIFNRNLILQIDNPTRGSFSVLI